MSGELFVNPQELEALGQRVEECVAKYKNVYTRIYNEIDSLSSSWTGEASQAFIAQIRGFQNDFEAMEQLLRKYAEFLRVSGNNYQVTENNNIENARNELTAGKKY